MSTPHKTSNDKLVSALRILAGEIESPDGVANIAIGEGADRIEELAAELARVAELEEKAERYRLTTLRQDARIAELVAEIERWRTATAKLRDGADESARVATEQLARAEQRNAELEAALTKIEDYSGRVHHLTLADLGSVATQALALARAKPAAPACIECGETTRVIREDGRCVVCDYKRHAAPAKRLDTERHMLAKALRDALDMMRRPVSALDYDAFTLRNKRAIDAARKQGGAS